MRGEGAVACRDPGLVWCKEGIASLTSEGSVVSCLEEPFLYLKYIEDHLASDLGFWVK